MLTLHNHSGDKCPSCGMTFSFLLKLRGHERRANNERQLNCDVSGKALLIHSVVPESSSPHGSSSSYQNYVLTQEGYKLRVWSQSPDHEALRFPTLCRFCFELITAALVAMLTVAQMSSSKSTENLISKDLLKVVREEV